MQTFAAIVVIVTVYGTLPCSGRPSAEPLSVSHFVSSSHVTSSNGGYQVSLSQTEVNGNCIAKVAIQGNGIHKVIEQPCNSTPKNVINLNNSLLVGDEYFADTHAVLVHLLGGGRCEKEVFQQNGGQFTSKVEPMSDKECEEVAVKIKLLKEQQEKWNQWYEEQQEKLQEEVQQFQQNLQHTLGQFFKGFAKAFYI